MTKRFRFRVLIVLFALSVFGMVKAKAQDFTLPIGVGVRAVAWNSDYTLLAVANPDGDVVVLDAESREVARLKAHSGGAIIAAWSPDGSLLATGGRDDVLRVWQVSDWSLFRELQAWDYGVGEVSWNASGTLIAASGFDTFQVWDTRSWEPLTKGLSVSLVDLKWHPNDPELFAFAASRYSGVNRFDSASVLGFQGPLDPPPIERLESLAWSTDGQYVAVAGHDWIFVWQSTDGKGVATIEVKGAYFLTVSFISDDGASLVAISDSGDVYTVDVTAGRAERVATVEGTPLTSAWNPVTQTLWIGGVANREDDSPENVILVSLSAEDLGLSLPTPTE